MDDQKRINELYEKAIKSMREYSAHDVKKVLDIADRGYGKKDKDKDVMDDSNNSWIPLEYIDGEWFEDERLKDHYFYLVAHKKFATPMKAKYHDDGGIRRFQIMSVSNDIRTRHNFDDVYSWDDSITHWMELPDMPEVEGVVFGDKKYWEEKD